MQRSALCLAISLSLILLISCGRREGPQGDREMVVTSIYPIFDIVKHVAGEHASVLYVVPAGANPHHFEPLPAAVEKMQGASLFIGVHPGFDGWITDLLPRGARTEFLLSSDPAHQDTNPHVWLSPSGAERIATAASRLLSALDPDNREAYRKNLISYRKDLAMLDSTLSLLFGNLACRTFIQWHPAWDYLAHDYDLRIAATVEHGHGDEPSVREFRHLVEEAKKNRVSIVVGGLYEESRATEALVREIDGILLKLDTIGDPGVAERATYIKMMINNAQLLSTALNLAGGDAAHNPMKE